MITSFNIEEIISQIQKDLHQNLDLEYQQGATRYFKEQIKIYGVRAPIVRKIAANYNSRLKKTELISLWPLCEKLMQSGFMEEATIALAFIYKKKSELKIQDFRILQQWLNKYVTNWAICDDLSTHLFGFYIDKFPEIIPRIKLWAKSKNRWVRRASAVSFIQRARHGNNLSDVLEIVENLLNDKDDLIQKGCGWVLRECSKNNQKEIIEFISKHKQVMPRTMLRYAIELFPQELRNQLMAK